MRLYTELAVDPVQELRYRCWARENYVAQSQRQENWHPLILEEMQRKDDEDLSVNATLGAYSYVPLEPFQNWTLNEPHPEPNRPNLLLSIAAVPAITARTR